MERVLIDCDSLVQALCVVLLVSVQCTMVLSTEQQCFLFSSNIHTING